jgi:hypothetical protein
MGGCSTVEGREGRSSTAAAWMAQWRGNAGGGGGKCGVFIGVARLRGDGSGRRRCHRGTQPRPARVRRGAAVGPAVHGARPAGTARTNGGARPGRTPRSLGAWARGEVAVWDGGRPWARHAGATSWRGSALAQIVLLVTSLKLIFSKILYKSAPNIEYKSCRSSYPLPLSKRLYSVFLNRFCRKGLPTLNATQFHWTGGTDLWASFSSFSPQNLKCQSTWKLCPSTSWTTFIKVDF